MAESKTELFPTAGQSPLQRCSANLATRGMLNKRIKYDTTILVDFAIMIYVT